MPPMDDKLIRVNNLKAVLAQRGMTASDLARQTGKRVSHYSDLLRGAKPFGEKAARTIEEELDLPRGALDSFDAKPVNVAKVHSRDRVPLLSLKALQTNPYGNGAVGPASEAGGSLELLLCPVAHSPETFAIRVVGDSMDGPGGRRYPAGSIVYVDPAVAPASGRAVLAKLPTGDVTLKVLREEDGLRWLAPLHPQYPSITSDFEVLGTVIGSFQAEAA